MKKSLGAAVAKIESESSAEVVVVVRGRSAGYLHIDLSVGLSMAALTLAAMLYTPWHFAWHFILINPILMALGASLASSRLGRLQRGLSRQETMDASVKRGARAAFVESGVHHTQFRSGALVYVSLLERKVALVADSGIELAFPEPEWRALGESLTQSLQSGADDFSSTLDAAAPSFAKFVPPREGERNELPNEVPDEVLS